MCLRVGLGAGSRGAFARHAGRCPGGTGEIGPLEGGGRVGDAERLLVCGVSCVLHALPPGGDGRG